MPEITSTTVNTNAVPLILPTLPTTLDPNIPPVAVEPAPIFRDWVAPDNALNLDTDVAANWSPSGTPNPGDTLSMGRGIMDINSDLHGDTLFLGQANAKTDNLINLVGPGTSANLETTSDSNVFLNLFTNGLDHNSVDLRVHQSDVHVAITGDGGKDDVGDLTSGAWNLTESLLDIRGGLAFVNSGVLGLDHSSMFIHDNVVGVGNMVLSSSHGEVGGSVGANQSIELSGDVASKTASSLTVDQPGAFDADVRLQYGHVDLNLAATVDSYSYANDMMSLFSNGRVVDTLKLSAPDVYQDTNLAMTVSRTATGVTIDNSGLTQAGSFLLPVHA
jgi:hypothetical protein